MKNVQLTKANLTEGIYIPSIEAKWLYKENKETGNYTVEARYLDKLLSGKIDYSFELVANNFLTENINVHEYQGKLFTLDIINVRYSGIYKELNEEGKETDRKSTKQLRDWAYTEGFVFHNNRFSNWKRSSGKARVGECLFIREDMANECIDWSRMDLAFTGEVDIASVRAYESLPLSSIIGTVEIDPQSILVIDDHDSSFDWMMSETKLVGAKLETNLGKTTERNSIWDGQGLMDESVFTEHELIDGKGFALLRNRYFKCAAFNTNIELFFRDHCEANDLDYDTFSVKDIFGREMLAKDIKLITTPNSIKINKFTKQVREKDGYDYDNSWLDYWMDNCGSTFGVCMTEQASRYEDGTYNRLSYQMVNTIPFTREELTELTEHEREHIERLKNDLDYFIEEANLDSNNDVDVDDYGEEIVVGEKMDTIEGFTELVQRNKEFMQTQVFKDYRRNFIVSQVRDLRQGKIRVEGDYCTLLGNPIEMLHAAVGSFTGEIIALAGNKVNCPKFGQQEAVVGFRNPHVCAGNIANLVNEENDLIDRYINATENIVVINSIDYPLLTTLQGADFDSDTMLVTSNDIIVKAASRVDHSVTPVPTNAIANTGKNDTELTGQNMSDIDHTISQNYIGEDINLSQQLNSWMNHKEYNNELVDGEYDEIYEKVSRCSSISCVEIDKAKKQFLDLDVRKEMDSMKIDIPRVSDTDNRMVKAEFFKYIGDNAAQDMRAKTNSKHRDQLDEMTKLAYAVDKGIKVEDIDEDDKELAKLIKKNAKVQKAWEELEYRRLDTPMDWLQEEVDSIPNADRMSTIQVIQLVKKSKKKGNAKAVKQVASIIKQTNDSLSGIRADRDVNWLERKRKIDRAKRQATEQIQEQKLTKADMTSVMIEVLNSVKKNGKLNKRTGLENIALDLLFRAYGSGLLAMFATK